jgi:hypothetical protein
MEKNILCTEQTDLHAMAKKYLGISSLLSHGLHIQKIRNNYLSSMKYDGITSLHIFVEIAFRGGSQDFMTEELFPVLVGHPWVFLQHYVRSMDNFFSQQRQVVSGRMREVESIEEEVRHVFSASFHKQIT